MADGEIVKWMASLGVGGLLAYAMFLVYRKDMQASKAELVQLIDLWREQAQLWKSQQELVLAIVRDNSAAMTRNTSAVESNTAVMSTLLGPRDLVRTRKTDP